MLRPLPPSLSFNIAGGPSTMPPATEQLNSRRSSCMVPQTPKSDFNAHYSVLQARLLSARHKDNLPGVAQSHLQRMHHSATEVRSRSTVDNIMM